MSLRIRTNSSTESFERLAGRGIVASFRDWNFSFFAEDTNECKQKV
jgi:hypothetical protein